MDLQWVQPFLRAVAAGSTISEAALAAGISTSTVYHRKRNDADFAEALHAAEEDSADLLEAEARRRAIDGVEEPVVYQGRLTPVWERDEFGEVVMDEREGADGKPVQRPRQARNPDGSLKWLTIRKPSDALLALLLKGRRKSVFSDRTELTGADGGPMVVDSTMRAARVAALLQAARERKTLDDLV